VDAEIFTNFGVFVHNLGYRYARKPSKGSKYADFDLVSKKILSQNDGLMGWDPGPDEGGQKNAKTPPLLEVPPENAKPKTKNVFFSILIRLAESVDGLDNSLAQSASELWSCKNLKSRVKKVAHDGLKG